MGTEENNSEGSHDAILRVFDASDRLDKKLVSWQWADGRRTISPDEHEVADELIGKAEQRVDPDNFEHGTEIAHVWMDGEELDTVKWCKGE